MVLANLQVHFWPGMYLDINILRKSIDEIKTLDNDVPPLIQNHAVVASPSKHA
jgi:hypothetical protein